MSVYFIRVGDYFKIGSSDDPQRRFERLHQSGSRYTFPADASWSIKDRELYRVIDGDKSTERAIHLILDNWAVGLEWFLAEPALVEYIDGLPEEPSTRDLFDAPRLERDGGWCEDEYRWVQHGRAVRETARFNARRSA